MTDLYELLVSAPGIHWRKSSFSDNSGPVCVELGAIGGNGAVAIRDSKRPEGPALAFTQDELRAFVLGAKAGEFDDLIA